jgi:hypothetical protein
VIELAEARTQVDGWLDEVALRAGKCSTLLRNQLAEGMRRRTIDAHAIYDEIAHLENPAARSRGGTKSPEPLGGDLLRGLMHKHYPASSMASFMLNQRNHWRRPDNQERLTEIIKEFIQDGHTGKLVHALVLGAHTARHSANQMTGE